MKLKNDVLKVITKRIVVVNADAITFKFIYKVVIAFEEDINNIINKLENNYYSNIPMIRLLTIVSTHFLIFTKTIEAILSKVIKFITIS